MLTQNYQDNIAYTVFDPFVQGLLINDKWALIISNQSALR